MCLQTESHTVDPHTVKPETVDPHTVKPRTVQPHTVKQHTPSRHCRRAAQAGVRMQFVSRTKGALLEMEGARMVIAYGNRKCADIAKIMCLVRRT